MIATICAKCSVPNLNLDTFKVYDNTESLKGMIKKWIEPTGQQFKAVASAMDESWLELELTKSGPDIVEIFRRGHQGIFVQHSAPFDTRLQALYDLDNQFNLAKIWLENKLGEPIEIILTNNIIR